MNNHCNYVIHANSSIENKKMYEKNVIEIKKMCHHANSVMWVVFMNTYNKNHSVK
jgi:hypothetical protein